MVEGPLNNLQPSMIQFSKPRRPYDRNANTNRFEHNARDLLGSSSECECGQIASRTKLMHWSVSTARNGAPLRYDPDFFRTHDAIGSIASDAQSVRSQATYSSGLPTFSQSGYPNGVKRGASSYASSTLSQDLLSATDNQSIRDDASSVAGGASSIAYSQADRLRRSSLSMSDNDYMIGLRLQDDDDGRSNYTASQSGTTDY